MKPSSIFCWSVTNDIGIISINNGPHNLISAKTIRDLDTFKDTIESGKIKGLIITGNQRHFSAGADLDDLKESSIDMNNSIKELNECHKALNYISSLDIVTVAQISGVCFGVGLEIALSCHVRICSFNAIFAMPESNHNIIPGLNGTIKLPKLIGYSKALEMILSGNIINAHKALETGLVDYKVPKKELREFTLNYITNITKNKPLHVIKSIINSINDGYSLDMPDALNNEAKIFSRLVDKKYNTRLAQ